MVIKCQKISNWCHIARQCVILLNTELYWSFAGNIQWESSNAVKVLLLWLDWNTNWERDMPVKQANCQVLWHFMSQYGRDHWQSCFDYIQVDALIIQYWNEYCVKCDSYMIIYLKLEDTSVDYLIVSKIKICQFHHFIYALNAREFSKLVQL